MLDRASSHRYWTQLEALANVPWLFHVHHVHLERAWYLPGSFSISRLGTTCAVKVVNGLVRSPDQERVALSVTRAAALSYDLQPFLVFSGHGPYF